MIRRALLFLAVLGSLLQGPHELGAADADLPAYRSIDANQATSTCIGNPATPLCAVETYLACGVRREQRLCAASMGDSAAPPDTWRPAVWYVVVDSYTAKEHDTWGEVRNDPYVRPGDVHLTVAESNCPPAEMPCQKAFFSWQLVFYWTTREGAAWRVVESSILTGDQ
jgi:hypothetical protein